MANVKKQIENAKKIADGLMELNQNNFVRGERMEPIGVDWDVEKHKEMFDSVHALKQTLEWVLEDLEHIY